jgi:branched-chain amino acid transport system substrate-binding protein
VVGANVDGPEWITSKNMFSVFGTQDFTKVQTTYGVLLKKLGATTIGSLGTGISPSSSESAKATAVSAQAAGLRVGYLNANVPFGTTNVDPYALAMKSAGVDGLITSVNTSTSLALITALRQKGATIKAAILPTGYGGDLLHGGPGATKAAEGNYFLTTYEPVELQTPATKKFQAALKTHAGVTSEPTFGEYIGYVSVDGFVTGLKAAGPNPTRTSFINAMLGINHYDAAGLFGSHSIGFGMSGRGQTAGPENCTWVSKFSGGKFQPVAGATPICGSVIPGKTVTPAS